MSNEDFDKEIERLKVLKTQISSKISVTNDFNEREKLEIELSNVNSQIRMLEIFKKKF